MLSSCGYWLLTYGGVVNIIGELMSNSNKPDVTEEWLLNEATQEDIERIANG